MALTPIHTATLRYIANPRTVAGRRQTCDLRKCSEPMRQAIIDLGMMEPPLVQVDADMVTATEEGAKRAAQHEPSPGEG